MLEFSEKNSLVRFCHVRDCPNHYDHFCSVMKDQRGFIPYALCFVPDGAYCRLEPKSLSKEDLERMWKNKLWRRFGPGADKSVK